MRIRLFWGTFLLVAGIALTGELAMAGVMALNLRRSFHAYLVARDRERVDALARAIEREAEAAGGPAALRARPGLLRAIVAAAAPPLPPLPALPLPPRSPTGRPPYPPPDAFEARLLILDAGGRPILGPAAPLAEPGLRARSLERALNGGDGAIGRILLFPRGRPPQGIDARFLTSQYRGAAILALVLLALSLLPAWLIARAGSGAVGRMAAASRAIAGGDFSARVPAARIVEADALAVDINRMAERLGQLDSARRRWLAEVSHELRTPLTAMRGEIDAVRDGVRPLTRAAIESLAEEVASLGRLVEDLHYVALGDLSAPYAQFAPCDAAQLCRQAVARFAGAPIAIEATGLEAPVPVSWDAARIQQLLGNALTNSLRYTDAPGRIRLALAHDDATVTITLDDSPPGVPKEQLPQLFEPLFRVEQSRDRAAGGSGLGLSVARTIAQVHGGGIAAQPSPLGGLRLVVTLPVDALP